MNLISKWLLAIALVMATSSTAASNKTKLYGNWKGVSSSSIQIHLKKSMRYVYRYKMLTFTGKWSVSGKNVIFNYSVLGSQKKKKASFSFRKGFLTLRSHDHATVVLKKSR